MIAFPNCKINLGLYIENKRTDGFHTIKTILYPVELRDVLEIIESETNQFSMTMSGIPVNCDLESNLCVRAYKLLKKDFNLPAVKIHLHKVIPYGAGMGGGSSDAAYTIKILNNKFELKLSIGQMQEYASSLGSDCAFFIENKAVLAREKGDVFENTNITLSGYHLLIVKPAVYINTTEAYQWVKPRNTEIDIVNILNQPIECWKDMLINDFEESVFKNHPIIASIKDKLYQNGAIYASLSGSGSAVFGIFRERSSVISFPMNSFFWESKV
jgi:4-diphosphocytidyl-2-C-methyl-D-erythritol kinase